MKMFCLIMVLLCSCSAQWDPHTVDNRQVIVHLFEWKWTDIADECERYLGPFGFGGVQISPPSEHRVIRSPWRPWWERYQPVSYELTSRSGTEIQLRDMIRRCHQAGVRIYVDAVINHMARGDSGYGIAGNWYDVNTLNYPGVPYNITDFGRTNNKCKSDSGNVEDNDDVNQVRNCRLLGLPDLDTSRDDVRAKISDYMNHLIDMGVTGFRVDAAKYIWPEDLGNILRRLNNLSTEYFPSGRRPFVYQEVIDKNGAGIRRNMTEAEYVPFGRVTEFKYGPQLGEAVRGLRNLSNINNWMKSEGMLDDSSALVFVDNHDNQRGHGGGKGIITFKEPEKYKISNVFMLAYPYGFTRVMSSFVFDNTEAGPPADANGYTLTVTVYEDGTCGGGWVCEHRWRPIRNMVAFRNIAAGQPLRNWWSNGSQQIAFGRGDRAFVVINNDDYRLSQALNTGLPTGEYCNIIVGDFDPLTATCSGPTIRVDQSGNANFSIDTSADPMVAIHVGARVDQSIFGRPSEC
ncbi:alpha-amylase-like [Patiria miniata]|uniref:Alpha-amylase n=1 Tax=Patiria miniata TaxID=46514 RepID=A0A914AR54_PATMI|nr:alpha-amylase-like [Patiria miniata]